MATATLRGSETGESISPWWMRPKPLRWLQRRPRSPIPHPPLRLELLADLEAMLRRNLHLRSLPLNHLRPLTLRLHRHLARTTISRLLAGKSHGRLRRAKSRRRAATATSEKASTTFGGRVASDWRLSADALSGRSVWR